MPKGFFWLRQAQFLPGLADHAVLIVASAFLQERQYPMWSDSLVPSRVF